MIYYKEAQETIFTTGYWKVNNSYIRILDNHYKLLMGIYEDTIYITAWESIMRIYKVSPGQLHLI
jgi:hypothetical protein